MRLSVAGSIGAATIPLGVPRQRPTRLVVAQQLGEAVDRPPFGAAVQHLGDLARFGIRRHDLDDIAGVDPAVHEVDGRAGQLRPPVVEREEEAMVAAVVRQVPTVEG
jgi:hypothetical protein